MSDYYNNVATFPGDPFEDDGVSVEWKETTDLKMPWYRWIEWRCPACDEVNLDSPNITAIPVCGDCERPSDWDTEFMGIFDEEEE